MKSFPFADLVALLLAVHCMETQELDEKSDTTSCHLSQTNSCTDDVIELKGALCTSTNNFYSIQRGKNAFVQFLSYAHLTN